METPAFLGFCFAHTGSGGGGGRGNLSRKKQAIHEIDVGIITCVFLSLRGPLCAADCPVPGETDVS